MFTGDITHEYDKYSICVRYWSYYELLYDIASNNVQLVFIKTCRKVMLSLCMQLML